MSDLEATGSRAQSAAPITAVAAGKLRAISGNQPLFAQSEGLVDAFAEVFARMSESSTGPIESPAKPWETDDDSTVSDEPAPHGDAGAESKPEPKPAPAETVVDVGQPTSEVEQDEVADEAVLVERFALADKPDDVEVNGELQVAGEIVVADVEFEQADSVEAEIDTPEVIAPEVVQSDGNEHSRRHRRESASARPIENAEGGHWKEDRSLPTEQNNAVGEETGRNAEQLLNQSVEKDQAESTRGLRGRPRYSREATDNHTSPVSQTNQARTQQRAQQVANTAPSSEPIAGHSGQSDAASSPPAAKTSESQIAQVQGVAASVNRSGTPGRVQSGARGSTQAIESTVPRRNVAGTKPASQRLDSNTKETLSRIKLIQRVSKAFQHLGPEGGVVRLRLAPAEMGSVRVEMRIHQRNVQARVVAETEAASTALREHLPDLRARLESFGMQVDKIEIETDSHDHSQGSQLNDESHGHGQQRGHGQNHRQLHRPGADVSESVSPIVSQPTSVNPAQSVSSGVDVRL